MGLFKKIKDGVKRIGKGFEKAIKKVGDVSEKFYKKIGNFFEKTVKSRVGKALLLGAATIFTGGAIAGAMGGAGFLSGGVGALKSTAAVLAKPFSAGAVEGAGAAGATGAGGSASTAGTAVGEAAGAETAKAVASEGVKDVAASKGLDVAGGEAGKQMAGTEATKQAAGKDLASSTAADTAGKDAVLDPGANGTGGGTGDAAKGSQWGPGKTIAVGAGVTAVGNMISGHNAQNAAKEERKAQEKRDGMAIYSYGVDDHMPYASTSYTPSGGGLINGQYS